ncbi:hypothetical protein CEUSTIGMA_g9404.t1 [Chlamydomonas eustigma]|uniref:peptide-methionine (S)-S-oxide reductase n=1 Tax=Chlamydomonas eustigma TaxID=1157962 RepID=A0A250XG17_9CHLO|nr:hypothetical protein CEUSTIGMA_g9404.t1 [Chlamydomonas eustigma]|eukprot:GAX81976.1 hypothetical protein CEUSTIGMA_g9404.t1 [Chlamydomonas eustigma]
MAITAEVITLGGGCFWCLEACYQQLKGVQAIESGYAAGHVKSPTYKQVCAGDTGHAEVVQVSFDSNIISLADILHVFFTLHDPTTKDRQGNDVGTQYRSIVLYHSDSQKTTVEQVMEEVNAQKWYSAPMVTQVQPYDPNNYYKAEDYHQNYYRQNPNQGYCSMVVGPKVSKIRSNFLSMLLQQA